MNDNSIIINFKPSERQKRLKESFYNSKPKKLTSISPQKREESKTNAVQDLITDDDINKFIEENSKNLFPNSGNGISPQQMNIIYTQNKLMERNVDLLQENQRSTHDFILYLLRKDALKRKNNINPHQLKELLNPLYANINELKGELKKMHQTDSKKQSSIDENTQDQGNNKIISSNLNAKVDELVSLNKEINREKSKAKSINQMVNKQQNAVVLKAISDIKSSMGNMTQEINKMGNTFQEKINKVIEETEKDKIKNILNTTKKTKENDKLNESNQSNNANGSLLRSRLLDEIDYNEYKNDILDINLRKEEIIKDFRKKTPIVPDLKKPKGRINFSYNIDYPTSTSSNMSGSSTLFDNDNSRNIFNQNLSNNTYSQMREPKRATNMTTSIYNNKPTQGSTIWNNNENLVSNNTGSAGANYYSENRENTKEQIDYEKEKAKISSMNIADRMREYQQKMTNQKGKVETVDATKFKATNESERSLNPFTMEQYKEEMPTGNKSRITLKEKQPIPQEPIIEYNPIPKQPQFKVGVFSGESIKPVDRKEITTVNVAPKEKEDKQLLEDVLLKLCADKIMKRNSNINKPVPLGYPHGVPEEDMKKVTEQVVQDYIRDLLKNKKKPEVKKDININIKREPAPKGPNEICKIYEKEYIHNTVNNGNNNDMLEQLMKNLIDKFGGIEAALNNLNLGRGNINNDNQNRVNQIPNLDDIAIKISERIKHGINVKVNVGGQNNDTSPIILRPGGGQGENIPGSISGRIGYNKQGSLQYNQTKMSQFGKDTQQSQIFDDTRKIEMEELDHLIKMPHRINLAEYEISQTSSYISDVKNETKTVKNEIINLLDQSNNSNSLSKGQVVTDQSDFTNSINKELSEKNRNGLDLLMLKNFNENLPQNIIQNFDYDLKTNNLNINNENFEDVDDGEEEKREYSIGEVRSDDEYEEGEDDEEN